MASADFYILPFISCLWATLGSSATTSRATQLHEEEGPSEDQVMSSTTVVTSTAPPNANPESYLNRLDFISVIVICAIVAFCFGICVIIGCRRKKRRPSQLDFTDSQLPSVSVEPRVHVARTTNVAHSPSDLRVPESPPPTYSIIERQTSFTSYVSQSSSHYEIPPGYDEALSIGDASNGGEPYAHRPSRPGSRTSSNRFFPVSSGAQPKRSESAHARGPPKSRTYRSSSDVGRARRARLSARPATVSEDDTSSLTTSALTNPSTVLDMSASDATHAISVIAEVAPTSLSRISNSGCDEDLAESVQPLLPCAESLATGSDTDDTISAVSSQKKVGLATRKLTLV